MNDWRTNWLTDLLTDSLTDWLNDLLTDQLTGLLTYSLTHWLTDWMTKWMTDELTGLLTYSLTHSLTDWMTYWLTNSLTHSFTWTIVSDPWKIDIWKRTSLIRLFVFSPVQGTNPIPFLFNFLSFFHYTLNQIMKKENSRTKTQGGNVKQIDRNVFRKLMKNTHSCRKKHVMC